MSDTVVVASATATYTVPPGIGSASGGGVAASSPSDRRTDAAHSGIGQPSDRAACVRVTDARRRLGERRLDGFGLAVHAAGRQQLRRRVVVREHRERADDDGAVTVGRELEDLPVCVARGGEGLDPFAAMTGEIGRRQRASVGGCGAHDRVGRPPFVERARALGGNELERARLRRVGEHLPGRRRGSAGEEHLVRIGRELAGLGGPLVRLFDAEREAVARQPDRRLQARAEIQAVRTARGARPTRRPGPERSSWRRRSRAWGQRAARTRPAARPSRCIRRRRRGARSARRGRRRVRSASAAPRRARRRRRWRRRRRCHHDSASRARPRCRATTTSPP